MKKIVDGVEVEMSADEIAQRQAEEQAWVAEQAATKWKRDREAAYPSVQDQLEILFNEGIDVWKKVIKSVKDAYPNPNATQDKDYDNAVLSDLVTSVNSQVEEVQP